MKLKMLLFLGLFYAQLNAQTVKIIDLDKNFDNYKGSFVLLDLQKNQLLVYNDSIASKRFSPCSTFKITNSLIAIESGIAKDGNYKIEYDSTKIKPQQWWHTTEPFKFWMQDHTMKTAIKISVVWYYQELARRIGEDNMKTLLEKINYGNNDISSGIDNFWLCGSLKISAKEQVEFIKRLHNAKIEGFTKHPQEQVKKIMPSEITESYKLYAKTGGGDCWDNKIIGWYVGFVETKSGAYIFALNLFANEFKDIWIKRKSLTKEILQTLKIID